MSLAQQKSLFVEEAPWDEDDAAEQLVATVVFATGPTQEFDYSVPDRLRASVEPGRRVHVPFGRGSQPLVGYCVRVANRRVSSRRLKEVRAVIDEARLLSPAMLRLTEWMADYYLCPLGQVLETVLPAGVRGQAGTRLTTFLSLSEAARQDIGDLKLPAKQLQVLQYLAGCSTPVTNKQLEQAVGCKSGPIDALKRKGLIQVETRRMRQGDHAEPATAREDHLVLNPDQRVALEAILAAINSGRHQTLLLHGITGSGKTEVYIHAIAETIRFGRQALVLVPEISLTPQTKERFRARFGQVAVLHSNMSDSERHQHWQSIARGEVPVVVGARSAVFAPTPHLGLIVLDEEHEGSFKQDTAPRYHARDVAWQRAKAENIPLVLGSATPSLESWQRASTKEYCLLELPRRVHNRPLPGVGTIDLRNEARNRQSRGAIGRQLERAMRESLGEGGQVILLLNRRGFSTHIQCPACGHVVRCPSCEIALTHHKEKAIALCHYCEFEIPTPRQCPECDFVGIRYSGLGTQRLEAEVREGFPEHPCLRMDTDTMQRPGSHEKALAAFRSGEVRILLGTQMIAKGLDFPNVTLVGVLNADTALHWPDFRASERTFQLLVQVAGRSGRGDKGGQVLVQTFNPDHPAIRFAVQHDYAGFCLAAELPTREGLLYPPFAAMVRLVVRGPKQDVTREFAQHVGTLLREALAEPAMGVRILGPAPAHLAKLRDNYRFQMQLNGPKGDVLRRAVREIVQPLKPPEDVQWIADVDPIDML